MGLQAACPKCMDEGGDDRSVRSTSSRKSYCSGTNGEGDAHGQFDKNGCCVLHPHIQGAKKKLFRRKSRGTGRVSDSSGSEALSRKDSTGSSTSKKKRIRVRNLRTEDEEGNHGQYTGYVNNDHQPDGDGVMKYTDGSRYDGVWNEGSKVHGKTTKRKV